MRPTSAVVRPTDVDQLSAVTSHRQQNGTITVSRQTASGVGESVGGLRRAVLYVLGEKTQMKVIVMTFDLSLSLSLSPTFPVGGRGTTLIFSRKLCILHYNKLNTFSNLTLVS